MQRLSLLLVLSALSAASAAQVPLLDSELLEEEVPEIRRYTVEIIIFSYAENVSVGSEVFLPDVIEIIEPDPLLAIDPDGERDNEEEAVPTFTDLTPIDDDDGEEQEEEETLFEMVLLTEEELTMTNKLDHLDELDAYEPLLHVGWTQTALSEEETPVLDIREFGEPPEGLTGGLTLYLSRYLHLVVDLELDAPLFDETIDPADPGMDDSVVHYGDERGQYGYEYERDSFVQEPLYAPLRYQINENRLFKNGETRYFDHPKFGVIAKVLRFEKVEEEFLPDDTEFLLPAVTSE
jgi:hypothetical protein